MAASSSKDGSLPWDRMMNDDQQPQPQQQSSQEAALSGDEQLLLEQFAKQASDLGIDLSDPRVKELLKRLGKVEAGELDEEIIDEIIDEQELDANLRTAEVIVEGIDETTFAIMLNNRIKGDEHSLKRLVSKTGEELKVMLVEALARDIPRQQPEATRADQEEAILDVILDQYGAFQLKKPDSKKKADAGDGSKGGQRGSFALDMNWVRNWGMPGLCLFLVLAYTAVMYYHYPESYTDYDKFVRDRRAAQQSREKFAQRDEL